ncbi:MAG: MbnH family di-heme enzyme, partial [Myxococcota bacterium]
RAVLVLAVSCSNASEYDVRAVLGVPDHFETPLTPAFNAPTRARVDLGRHLFYDERLSGNGTQSCASCHEHARAFADGRARPIGSTGQVHPRNSQGLANVAYFSSFTWANDTFDALEEQIRVPLTSATPVELGLTDSVREDALDRLRNDPETVRRFASAFPEDDGAITLNTVILSLASFVRSMVSGESRYDRYLQGDAEALTAQELLGLRLFNSERFECFHCHTGTHFTASYRDENRGLRVFFNNGLYNVDGRGAYPDASRGLIDVTSDPRDMGAFRPPTLRNVELTGPYMHDGSLETLRDVLDHYAAGGSNRLDGPNAGDGRVNPFKSNFVRGFRATEEELDAVEAFLRTLTDWEFIRDVRFSDPNAR